ncbi:MAG: hypothetical protein Q7W45_03375 [Bacteroidota bacterium]|nr:hypothetical protein [Bacteroidota bacterium]MDP3145704.1 hypothetical protein [Bacteroidota bacterium]
MKNKLFYCLIFFFGLIDFCKSQPVPSPQENIPFLVTFSKDADKAWGDDDFVQTFFVSIPKERTESFYIRVFDPEVGGKYDESKTGFNSRTKFSVYGGKLCFTDKDAIKTEPTGNYKSGILLKTKTFGSDLDTDDKWYTFGPFNPAEGELVPELGGLIFKIIIEGMEGNDGNLYKLFVSSQSTDNLKVEGANSFTYEYTFRTHDKVGSVSHIYPFITSDVISIKINSFDFDDDGKIRIVSASKKGEMVKTSYDNNWTVSEHKIDKEEINTSIDVQFIKTVSKINNNVVVYITNQYGTAIPFFTAPIGGIPSYKYKMMIKKK